MQGWTTKRIIYAAVGAILTLFLVFTAGKWFENVDAGEILVTQDPFDGELHQYFTAGVKPQLWGKVTTYHKRAQLWFSSDSAQGRPEDETMRIRFNDNAHARISGSFAWEMPTDPDNLNSLHQKYGSQRAIEQQLLRTVAQKSIYTTGPLMSSRESAAERRNEVLQLVEDQVQNGVYRTQSHEEKQPDPMTGQLRTIKLTSIVRGADGNPVRNEASPLDGFGIKIFNLSINEIRYDLEVEQQIQQQQQATMQVQLAIAKAKEAEQDAITAAKKGEADAAKAKWAQEVIKATAVTEAQQRLEVARLDAQAAAQTKLKETLLGEGEGARRRAVMQADGALDRKLTAWLEAQKVWAEAISKYQGAWVPSVVMGSGTSVAGSGAQQFMDILTAKTARDLGLDLSNRSTPGSKP
ncbi:MAG: hypothetical protein A2939_01995 [Parcubacteria group bacterium RIFCSPLOWO2_01_FULL_48_18]|nr:MAG: hypothetical protein A3J67_04670 [Parcubacteria group bacterium RIFCSPHIGHO2_02_FULL_48_10b]OHB22664.1 MAG: hypothetical protein A2939_01995 [Parcubacteria group bacterium RIFCSPLOWO2_01_FULL_48_18]